MPVSPAVTAGLSVSSTEFASPSLNRTAVTEVGLAVPPTVNLDAAGAAVVSSASSKVSVSVSPFTAAPVTVGAVVSPRRFFTACPMKFGALLAARSRSAFGSAAWA